MKRAPPLPCLLSIVAFAVMTDPVMRIEKVWAHAPVVPVISGLPQSIAPGAFDRA